VSARRLAVLTAALTATAALVVTATSSPPALGRTEAPHGSAGIGDPYFPLDGNGGIDVRRYDVHDRYRFADRRLSGRTAVTLRATETLSSFNLDFLLPVRSVTIGGRDVDFEKTDHELVVNHRVDAGDTVRLVVRYAGKPSAYSYEGESNWLASDHEVVAMNQPHMAPWWFPANDHPRDRAHVQISITVPKANRVVAGGRLVGRTVHGGLATTTWRADEPMVPYLAFFAAGRFQVERGRSGGRPWYSAVSKLLSPSEQQVAMGLMRQTPRLLRWVERRLGDYPFSTTGGLTTSLQPGFALENQTRPTYPYMGDGPGAVSIVVHELAHQWLGDSVSLEGWRDIWLNEGAATFMEHFYAETHGGETAQHWLRTSYDTDASDAFWDLEVADPCPDHTGCAFQIFDPRVYQRGAMALQALRNVVGGEDFWTLLRRWAAERAGGTGSTEQFQALAEQVSGHDLGDFFDAWVRSASKPADTAANGLG
jgi:aminopeptidase N